MPSSSAARSSMGALVRVAVPSCRSRAALKRADVSSNVERKHRSGCDNGGRAHSQTGMLQRHPTIFPCSIAKECRKLQSVWLRSGKSTVSAHRSGQQERCWRQKIAHAVISLQPRYGKWRTRQNCWRQTVRGQPRGFDQLLGVREAKLGSVPAT